MELNKWFYSLIQEPSHNANNQWLSVYWQVARSPYPKPPETVGTIIRPCLGEAQDWASRKTELLTTSRVGPSRPGTSSWARLCKEALCTMPALRIYRGLQSPVLSISQSSWAQLCTDNSKNNDDDNNKTSPQKLRATGYPDEGTANGTMRWKMEVLLWSCVHYRPDLFIFPQTYIPLKPLEEQLGETVELGPKSKATIRFSGISFCLLQIQIDRPTNPRAGF